MCRTKVKSKYFLRLEGTQRQVSIRSLALIQPTFRELEKIQRQSINVQYVAFLLPDMSFSGAL